MKYLLIGLEDYLSDYIIRESLIQNIEYKKLDIAKLSLKSYLINKDYYSDIKGMVVKIPLDDFQHQGFSLSIYTEYLETINLITKENSINKVVFLSSYGVYKKNQTGIYAESSELYPEDNLSLINYIFENYLLQQKNIRITILRLFNLYSINQPKGYIVPYLISNYIKNKTILIGNTNRIRDFIYIDDFLGIFERVIQNSFPGIFNVGSGKGNSIRDIFDICKEITGLERQVIFDPTKLRDEHDYPKVIADISLAKRTFDWEPKIDIKNGISKMITWYRSYES